MSIYEAVSLAHSILDMNLTIKRQEAELEELRDYKRKYDALLQSSIQHSEAMMTNYVNEIVSQDLRTKLEESTKRS